MTATAISESQRIRYRQQKEHSRGDREIGEHLLVRRFLHLTVCPPTTMPRHIRRRPPIPPACSARVSAAGMPALASRLAAHSAVPDVASSGRSLQQRHLGQ